MPTRRLSSVRTPLLTAVLTTLLVVPSAAGTPPAAFPVATSKLPIAQLRSIDRSMMRAQLVPALALADLPVQGRNLTMSDSEKDRRMILLRMQQDVQRIRAARREYIKYHLADSLYVGGDIEAGQGRPVETLPGLLYENISSHTTLRYDNIIDGLNGQDIGISFAVAPESLSTLIKNANELLAFAAAAKPFNFPPNGAVGKTNLDILSDALKSTLSEPNVIDNLLTDTDIKKVHDAISKIFPISATTLGPTDLAAKYRSVSQETAVSVSADDLLLHHRGHLANAGISISKLLPFKGSGPQPAVTPLLVLQQLDLGRGGYQSRSSTRFGASLIWQDRKPDITLDALDTDASATSRSGEPDSDSTAPPKSIPNLVAPWKVKAGLLYTSPSLGAHETYGEFVRCRDSRTYDEITVMVGKDGGRADYIDISLGKTFY